MKIKQEIMKPYLEKIAERVQFVLQEEGEIRDINRIVYEFGQEMLPEEISNHVFVTIGMIEGKNETVLGYLSKDKFEIIQYDGQLHFCSKEHWNETFGNPYKNTKLLPINDLTFTN
ncbi:hypothetical protein F400_gp073 [Bacillus phage BCD7]|uniref:Uncharacterized protein n=1 Tax=Bacillus phage BCD7 TaxID=1136534 RepID=J9PVB5_9CAUD|nr:hypothetical protein F400_gp073 [Bacillus phage BCD7]AEZ50520.1 hypothetical protein BCD7_0073 [Bacillus phage BCD7]